MLLVFQETEVVCQPMIKLKSLLKESLKGPDKSLGEFLLAHKTVSFSDWVYHGTPLVGLKEMLVNGISGMEHGEMAESSTFSTSVNSEIIHYFSEGDGETGLQFQVKNVKLLIVEDIVHKLMIELAGSGMDVEVDEQEFEQFCRQYNIPVGHRGEPYLPYGYLSSLGIDAFMFDYAWQRLKRGNIPHNDESEVCFVGKGIDLLNQSIETIYVKGTDYEIKDKALALQDIESKL